MSRHSPSSGKPPTAHTAIIGDVAEMWSKLVWDVEIFRDIQITYPDEREPLAYAAINVCITANSLKNWVNKAVPKNERKKGESPENEITRAIPLQPMCDAIANTSKHSSHSDGHWGGSVSLDWESGDEDVPGGYVLRYFHARGAGGEGYDLTVNQFQVLLDDWCAFLLARNLMEAEQVGPAWMQRKMLRIFPPIQP